MVLSEFVIFNRPYLSNGRAIGMVKPIVVCLSVCVSVRFSLTDVLWLSFRS